MIDLLAYEVEWSRDYRAARVFHDRHFIADVYEMPSSQWAVVTGSGFASFATSTTALEAIKRVLRIRLAKKKDHDRQK